MKLAQAGSKAAGPVLRRAASAGATYRLWQLRRDAGVDPRKLSDTQNDRLTAFLARHGEDGAEIYLTHLEEIEEIDMREIEKAFEHRI